MKNIITLIFAIIISGTLFAQKKVSTEPIDVETSNIKGSAGIGAFGEPLQTETDAESKISKSYYKNPAHISKKFTGYSIQLMTSMERLEATNKIFSDFGDLMIEEATNPKYCYLLGEFKTKEGAEKFLKFVLSDRYPEAIVVRYKEGNRKK